MGVRAISFAGAEGNRFSWCLGFGGMDFQDGWSYHSGQSAHYRTLLPATANAYSTLILI